MSTTAKALTKQRVADNGDLLERVEAWWANMTLRWSIKERVRLYERLGRFLEHDIGLDEALETMIVRTSRPRGAMKQKHPMRHVYKRWHAGLRRGKAFTDVAVAGRDLPPGELVMLMMGDSTSNPADGFRQARFVADVVRRMKGALLGALTYPAILILMGSGFLAGIALKFGPQMRQMTDKPVEAWPFFAKTLYQLSVGVIDAGPWMVLMGVLLGVWSMWSLPNWSRVLPKVRAFLDHYVPPWSIYREYNASSTLIALGAMTQAASPVDESIARITSIASPWLQTHLRRILTRVRRGDDPGQSFDTGLLSDDTLGYLEDFNRAGGLDAALSVVGTETVEDAIARVQMGAVAMGIVALVAVVGLILLIYGGMMSLGLMVYQDAQAGH